VFHRLGKLVTRFSPLLLGFWIILLGVGWRFAPGWYDVTQGGDYAFLPDDAPSRRGEELFKRAFPGEYSASSVVLVISRDEGEAGLAERDRAFIRQAITPALKKLAAGDGSSETPESDKTAGDGREGPVIARVRSPDDPGVGALLVSSDNKAALVAVEMTTQYRDPRNWETVAQIEGLIDRLRRETEFPPGLDIALTGSATAGRDVGQAEQKSAHDVEAWTFAVVIALLVLTYRAPLVALIPLATVYVAVQVSLQVLALLAEAQVLVPSRDLRVFITVLAYGAGVDYCVFLIDRYQEELDAGASVPAALAGAIGRVGGAVAASAATVICGIGMLAFARFGKIREAGLTIPVCLILVLCAALTFGPSLMRLTGRWVFWPQRLSERTTDRRDSRPARLLRRNLLPDVWGKIGPALAGRPGLIWLTTVALMMPFAVVAVRHHNEVDYDPLGGLPETAPSVVGVRALERHFPPGLLGPVTVLLRNDGVDFVSEPGMGLVRALTDQLVARKSTFGIADVRSVTRPLGSTEAARAALARLPLPPRAAELLVRTRAVGHYVSHAGELTGHVTRLDLVLAAPPFSPQGIECLDRIEHSLETELPDGLREGSQVSFSGTAATIRDLRSVTRGDQTRVQILVPVAVLVLLLIVFRRVTVSLYLILSVLFSYLATLGATYAVFWLLDRDGFTGLDWKVPLFLFTILVAVGEDYNIFLMSRVDEEQRSHGPVEGVLRALARTGRIISTCGFIMAGTFAALFAGSFLAMKQLGFALAVGVLLDTLVVRPILVPTFLILLQRPRPGAAEQAGAIVDAAHVR
jgi:RND superfamily putative drug exporter